MLRSVRNVLAYRRFIHSSFKTSGKGTLTWERGGNGKVLECTYLYRKKHTLVENLTYTPANCRFIHSEFEIKYVNIEKKKDEKNMGAS
jgi:hypothetical protein